MSARPEVVPTAGVNAELFQSPMLESEPRAGSEPMTALSAGWNPEKFAREQIQRLVRRVFLSNVSPPIRQVVFSAVDSETDVRGICRRTGEALAAEDAGSVGVMGQFPMLLQEQDAEGKFQERTFQERTRSGSIPPLRRIATRVHSNLWLVPGSADSGVGVTTASLHSYLGELRREFEYSLVEGSADVSNDATAMAQFSDGIILVLSARHTRRATALKIKQNLEWAQARLLGIVLIDRAFPVPQGIYRRL